MSEREVSLKLSVKKQGDLGAPFAELAQAAAKAGHAVDALGSDAAASGRAVDALFGGATAKSQALAHSAKAAGEAMRRSCRDGSGEMERQRSSMHTEQARQQSMVRHAERSGHAGRSQRGARELDQTYQLQSEQYAQRSERQRVAEELLHTQGVPRAEVRSTSPRQQARRAAADILELHGAPPETAKQMRGSVKDEVREIDRARQAREELLGLDQKRTAAESDYQKNLERTIQALEQAKRLKTDLAARGYLERELTEEEKYQKALKQRIRDYETAKRMKEDLARAGVGEKPQRGVAGLMSRGKDFLMTGGGMTAVAEMAVAVKMGQVIAGEITNRVAGQRLSEYNTMAGSGGGLDEHAAAGRRLSADAASMKSLLGWIPGLGGAVETHNYAQRVSSKWAMVESNIQSAIEARQTQKERGEVSAAKGERLRGLERQQSTYHALGGYTDKEKTELGLRAGLSQKTIAAHESEVAKAKRELQQLKGMPAVAGVEQFKNHQEKLKRFQQAETAVHMLEFQHKKKKLDEEKSWKDQGPVGYLQRAKSWLLETGDDRKRAKKELQNELQEIEDAKQRASALRVAPLTGKQGEDYQRYQKRQAELGAAEGKLRFLESAKGRGGVDAAKDALRQIEEMKVGAAGAGMNSASEQARIHLRGQQAINAAQEALRKNPNAAGYQRGAALADYEQTIAHQVKQGQVKAEHGRTQKLMVQEERQTGRHLTQAQQHVGEWQQQVTRKERDKNDAVGDEKKEIAVNNLLAAREQLQFALMEQQEALTQKKELQIRQAEVLNQHSQQRLGLLESERGRMQGIVREEKEREQGRQEHFGLTRMAKQRTALGVARKLSKGQKLTEREIEFAQGMPEMFGKRLEGIARERTGQGSLYQQIKQLLPELGARQQQAEKALTRIDNKFQVEIKLNETALAEQIQRKVLPAVYQAMQQVQAAANNQMEIQKNRAQVNEAAQKRTLNR